MKKYKLKKHVSINRCGSLSQRLYDQNLSINDVYFVFKEDSIWHDMFNAKTNKRIEGCNCWQKDEDFELFFENNYKNSLFSNKELYDKIYSNT